MVNGFGQDNEKSKNNAGIYAKYVGRPVEVDCVPSRTYYGIVFATDHDWVILKPAMVNESSSKGPNYRLDEKFERTIDTHTISSIVDVTEGYIEKLVKDANSRPIKEDKK